VRQLDAIKTIELTKHDDEMTSMHHHEVPMREH